MAQRAFMLGDKDSLPVEVKNTLLKTGTDHILVVSGLHVGLILFTLFVFSGLWDFPLN